MSQQMKIKIEPIEVEEHVSGEKKIKVEDNDLNQSGFDEKAAKKRAKRAAKNKRYRSNKRLNEFFVRYLSPEVTEEKLKSLFSTCGNVIEAKLLKPKHGNLKMSGYAFIKYATKIEAFKAMKKLNHIRFPQKIEILWPKKARKYLQENDYQPVKKKMKLTDSEEIQKLKDTIENLKQENLKNDQMAKKFSEENKKLKQRNNNLKRENLKLCDVIKGLITQT